MKRIDYLALFIASIVMLVMTSCGPSFGKDLDYRKACQEGDFEKAQQIVTLLKDEVAYAQTTSMYGDENRGHYVRAAREKAEEAEEYVFKSEVLFLMSQDDEMAKKRIIYLLKEGGNDDHVSMLIDLAIENDDDAFVRTLANQYKEDVSEERLKKLMEYLSEKSDEENANFIDNYISKYLTISNTSLLKYIAGNKGQNNSEKVLGYLTIIEKDIPTRPALGLIKSKSHGKLDDQYDNYNTAIKNYNDACQTILNIAISSNNQYLAQRVITKAKPGLTFKELGDWCRVVEKTRYVSVYNAFRVTLDNADMNTIKTAYKEAVRSGAFK